MVEPKITLYDKELAHRISWPDSDWGRLAEKKLKSFLINGPGTYIDNVNAEFLILTVDDHILPMLLCDTSQGNSYLCSPYNHYINYAYDELKILKLPLLKPFIKSALFFLGKLLRFAEIDKHISINNWLLPSNLYPQLNDQQLGAIRKFLTKKFPHHALVFRSINDYHPKGLMASLKKLRFIMVPSRMIYFTDCTKDHPFKSRMFKSDLKVLKQSTYTIVEDVHKLKRATARIKELYWMLNIEKYSAYNPQFNEEYIRHALHSGWMTIKGFESDGTIDAVFGYLETDDIMTSPLFGYDSEKAQQKGLYRLISTQLLLDAKNKGKLLHQSAGAGHYKKLRRAEEHIEYMAVFCNHLPQVRRFAWRTLEWIMKHLGTYFLDKA